MKVQTINHQKALPIPDNWLKTTEKNLKEIAQLEGREPARELNIIIVDNSYIKSLNREFLGRDEPTDVIAFPLGDVGEIYVSAEVAEERAPGDALKELALYVIHGFLHLLGYDHSSPENEKILRKKEREYLNKWKK